MFVTNFLVSYLLYYFHLYSGLKFDVIFILIYRNFDFMLVFFFIYTWQKFEVKFTIDFLMSYVVTLRLCFYRFLFFLPMPGWNLRWFVYRFLGFLFITLFSFIPGWNLTLYLLRASYIPELWGYISFFFSSIPGRNLRLSWR